MIGVGGYIDSCVEQEIECVRVTGKLFGNGRNKKYAKEVDYFEEKIMKYGDFFA